MTAPGDVIAQWYHAFAAGEVERLVGLYAADAVFIGTTSIESTQDPADVRAYFERVMVQWRPATAQALQSSIQMLGTDAAVVTVFDKVTWVDVAGPPPSLGRVSVVLHRRDGAWRIVHFHRSALPQA